jgi:hypothetical protein
MAVVANPSFAVSLDASGNIDGNFTFNRHFRLTDTGSSGSHNRGVAPC